MGIPTLKLNSGGEMPVVGLGTSLVPDAEEMESAIEEALRIGYRHFDAAYLYKNEKSIGNVISKWLDEGKVKREDLFIVSKLPWHGMDPSRVEHFLELSLKALQLSYLDLYLVHWPIAMKYVDDDTSLPTQDGNLLLDHDSDLESIWKSMEKLVDSGKVKAIGLSNFTENQVERIAKVSRILPANLQVEMHLHLQQVELRKVCEKYRITVTAYCPLGSPRRAEHERFKTYEPPRILTDPIVLGIAKKLNKSPGSVLLRFLTQLGVAVVPKSINPDRQKENFESTSFDLPHDDMEKLKNLDKGEAGRALGIIPGSEMHKDCPFRPRAKDLTDTAYLKNLQKD